MNPQIESIGKLVSQYLIPFGQQLATSSGHPSLARLLADEQLHQLMARYSDSVLSAFSEPGGPGARERGRPNENGAPVAASVDDTELRDLNARLATAEAQSLQLLTLLEAVRTKMRPMAKALGCCQECLVGIDGCPACWGKSAVGGNQPDLEQLQSLIVEPLAASGVPLRLDDAPRRQRVANGRNHSRRETGVNHE